MRSWGSTDALQGSGWTFLSLSDPALQNLFQRHGKNKTPQPDGTGFIFFCVFIVTVVGAEESGLSCLRCRIVLHFNAGFLLSTVRTVCVCVCVCVCACVRACARLNNVFGDKFTSSQNFSVNSF